jgi:hypothetical protein
MKEWVKTMRTKKVDDRGRQNNESGVVQNQECGSEKIVK